MTVEMLRKFLEAVPDDYTVVSGSYSAKLMINPTSKQVSITP